MSATRDSLTTIVCQADGSVIVLFLFRENIFNGLTKLFLIEMQVMNFFVFDKTLLINNRLRACS